MLSAEPCKCWNMLNVDRTCKCWAQHVEHFPTCLRGGVTLSRGARECSQHAARHQALEYSLRGRRGGRPSLASAVSSRPRTRTSSAPHSSHSHRTSHRTLLTALTQVTLKNSAPKEFSVLASHTERLLTYYWTKLLDALSLSLDSADGQCVHENYTRDREARAP